jgi:hypothetical protein
MHGFVEKLWKFVTATYRCSMFTPLVTRHISMRWSNSCQTRVNISSSTTVTAVVGTKSARFAFIYIDFKNRLNIGIVYKIRNYIKSVTTEL